MGEFFTFANDDRRTAPRHEDVWPTAKLEAHFRALQETEGDSYISEERRATITRRMCHVAFEGLMRRREVNQREEEIKYLEDKYETFTSQQYTNRDAPDSAPKWKQSCKE